MSKPTFNPQGGDNAKAFNPAEPYTFNNTEEDKRELRKALVEWCEITEKFSRSFKGKYPNDESFSDRLRWSDKDKQFQWQDVHAWVFTDISKYSEVTYTPPEPIRVIMSGEKFDMENRFGIYWLKDGLIESDMDSEMPPKTLKEFLERFQMSWHTATLVSPPSVVEPEKKPEPRVFKTLEDLNTHNEQVCKEGGPSYLRYKVYYLNGVVDNNELEYEFNSWCYEYMKGYFQAAFKAGATVELVTPEQNSVVTPSRSDVVEG